MNTERLNINVNGVPSPGYSGDKDLFSELASLVNSDIPDVYIEFLTKVNGGHPEIGCFSALDDTSGSNLFDVDWFYSIDNPSVENVKDMLSEWGNVLGPKNLPIGRDGGGNQIYLNLESDNPTVWLYLHDENGAGLKLSNSFTEFLDSLISNPDFI